MYSRYRSENQSDLSLPARYSGVRFRRDKRSDGRDVIVEAPLREPAPPEDVAEEAPEAENVREAAPARQAEEKHGIVTDALSSLFGNVGEDDILLAALIIILAGEGKEGSREAILLLVILLCIR